MIQDIIIGFLVVFGLFYITIYLPNKYYFKEHIKQLKKRRENLEKIKKLWK